MHPPPPSAVPVQLFRHRTMWLRIWKSPAHARRQVLETSQVRARPKRRLEPYPWVAIHAAAVAAAAVSAGLSLLSHSIPRRGEMGKGGKASKP
ncbi:hypothetical protein V501_09093 [Pseudogymnoascus sp. VKM F-4519 (FW-2642)]|nr:hypothetical protein V501_09093 [Pseudogymnoascus sp. VKM F-4519 (FW-2642)]